MGRWRPEDDSLEVIAAEPDPGGARQRGSVGVPMWSPPAPRGRAVVGVVVLGLALLGFATIGSQVGRSSGDPVSVAESVSPDVERAPMNRFTALEAVAERATAEGLVVRTSRPLGLPDPCDAATWCPPPECRRALALVLQVASATGADVTQGEVIAGPAAVAPAMYVAGAGTGSSEGGGLLEWAAIRVPPAAMAVDLLIGGERRDTAPVVDGWAAVAAVLTGPGHLEAVAYDAAGLELGRVRVDDAEPVVSRTPPAACDPPAPPLPPPGASQPLDRVRAEEGVRAAYVRVFDRGSAKETRLRSLDDVRGLDEPMAYVAERFPRAVATTTVTVTDVVFTSATEAAVHFRLDYEGGSSLGNRLGEAVSVEGIWKVRRDTYCEVLAGAGTRCPAADRRR